MRFTCRVQTLIKELITEIMHRLKVSKNTKMERLRRRPVSNPSCHQMHHSHLLRSTTLLCCYFSSEKSFQGSPTYFEGTGTEMLFLYTTD